MNAGWQCVVAARIGGPLGATRWTRWAGSSFGSTWRLEIGGNRYYVKSHPAAQLPMLEAEAEGLNELAAAQALRVPAPVVCGGADGCAFLVLEWLDLESGGHDAALGTKLAQLHRTMAERFGWQRDNTIGTTSQENSWADDWATFFRDRRIAPQLALAARNGGDRPLQRAGERLLEVIPQLLAGHEPSPSLLHGDLWSGNAARLVSGEPVVFDPAVYFGDGETDLAMTELFGGFSSDFYAAYRAASPIDAGYPVRRTLYNLYHVLNHFNLFGGGYGRQAQTMMSKLLADVRR